MDEEILGIRNLDTGIGTAGVGFVVVPSNIDREQYIEDCYRTNTLSINGGIGYGIFNGVHADNDVMQNITFPTDEENRGTAVVWVRDSISQLPVIVAVLRKQSEYYNLSENQYRLKRHNVEKTRIVELFLDGDTSDFEIMVVGDKDQPARVNIKLSSQNKDSNFTLSCDNEINILSDKKITLESNEQINVQLTQKGENKATIKYVIEEGFSYEDEFGNEIVCKDNEITVKSDKINHNSGKEPMVLGDTLVNILNDLLKAIQQLTVISPVGATSIPVNVADFVEIQSRLETIKSKISNLE